MAINSKKYSNTGTAIQVAGLSSTGATKSSTAQQINAENDCIVEVQDTTGSGAWIKIGASDVVASAASGNVFIPPYGITRPFILKAGKYIDSTAEVNIRTLDIEV